MKKTRVGNLNIDDRFIKFIDDEAIKGTGIDRDNFWSGFDKAVHELAPINKKLLQKRDEIQKKIDEWHLLNKGNSFDEKKYFNKVNKLHIYFKVYSFKRSSKQIFFCFNIYYTLCSLRAFKCWVVNSNI